MLTDIIVAILYSNQRSIRSSNGIIEKHNMEYNGQDDFAKNVIAEIGLVKSEMKPVEQYHSVNMKADGFQITYREYDEILRANNKNRF